MGRSSFTVAVFVCCSLGAHAGNPLRPARQAALAPKRVTDRYGRWIELQVVRTPSVARTHGRLGQLLQSPARPVRLQQLLGAAKKIGTEESSGHRTGRAEDVHLGPLVGLLGLAAHSLGQVQHSKRGLFPEYVPDGSQAAYDKAWHFVNHAMLTYASLYDREFGDGATAEVLEEATNIGDGFAGADALLAANERNGGRLGGLAPEALWGPPDDPLDVAAGRWQLDMTDAEAHVVRTAARAGATHEVLLQGRMRLARVGRWHEFDPVARVSSTFRRSQGIEDPTVGRELMVNEEGAKWAVLWYRNPEQLPTVTFNEPGSASQPYARDKRIPFPLYYGRASVLLANLGGVNPADAAWRPGVRFHQEWALGADRGQVVQELLRKTQFQLGRLDKVTRARFYANNSVRTWEWGHRLTFDNEAQATPQFDLHLAWAIDQPIERLMIEIARRVDIVSAHADTFDTGLLGHERNEDLVYDVTR